METRIGEQETKKRIDENNQETDSIPQDFQTENVNWDHVSHELASLAIPKQSNENTIDVESIPETQSCNHTISKDRNSPPLNFKNKFSLISITTVTQDDKI